MICKSGALVGLALLATSVPASAMTLVLDDFSTDQIVTDIPVGTWVNSNSVAGGGTTGIGATTRTFSVTNTAFAGTPLGATQLQAAGGVLSFDNDSGARGRATITYDGVGDLMNSAAKGYFNFDVIAFDGIAEFAFSGLDGGGNAVSYSETLTSSFNPILRFSELTGYESFDFSDVASLTLSIDTSGTADSIDGRLDSITVAAVPLPATGAMLLFGAGALTLVKRRKKAAEV